jgi:hypothetical protein
MAKTQKKSPKQKTSGGKTPPGRAAAAKAKASTAADAKPRAKAKAAPARDPLDDFISAASQTLALPVEPAWQPAVKMNLAVILRQAAMVTEFSLPDDAEPAPVFEA